MKKLTILIFLTFLLVSCNTTEKTIKVDTSNAQTTDTQEKKETISWLEIDLDEFNKIYKQALFNTWKWNEVWVEQTKQTLTSWENIVSKYKGKIVEKFSNTNDLDSKLLAIEEYIKKADSMLTNAEFAEAHEQLEMVRKSIFEIRQENWIQSISDDMLVVHNVMENIVNEADSKNLEDYSLIKEWISKLKIYNTDNEEYIKMLLDYEYLVNRLETSSWDEYKIILEELKPSFIKMYLKFG